MKEFASELKRGTLELILLRLLAGRPKYGYELVRQLQAGGGGGIKEGTVYPVLYRLEDRGWIAPEWQAPARGVPRKYYQLTPAGLARLEELQREWRAFSGWVEGLLTEDTQKIDEPTPPQDVQAAEEKEETGDD